MDKIDQVFTTMATNQSFPALIWAAMNMAKWTLNCYYDHTDYSEVYRIAMGMYLTHVCNC